MADEPFRPESVVELREIHPVSLADGLTNLLRMQPSIRERRNRKFADVRLSRLHRANTDAAFDAITATSRAILTVFLVISFLSRRMGGALRA